MKSLKFLLSILILLYLLPSDSAAGAYQITLSYSLFSYPPSSQISYLGSIHVSPSNNGLLGIVTVWLFFD